MKAASHSLRIKFALGLILIVQTFCMIPNLWSWSPVWDEPGHMAAGLSHWQHSDFRPYSVNPPLCRMMATVPAFLICNASVPALDPTEMSALRGEFKLGGILFESDPQAAIQMLRAARCVAMVWPLIGTFLLYWIGSRIFSSGAGLLAAVGWALNPMVLAHGVLLPPDIPAAVGLMIIAIASAVWMRNPSSGAAIFVGLAIGLAVLIKTTLLIAYLVVPVLGIGAAIYARKGVPWRAAEFLLAVSISLFVVNAGYFWTGSFTRLGDFTFVSELLSGIGVEERLIMGNRFDLTVLTSLPVPLPKDLVLGIDVQYRDFERGGFYPYLAGKWDRDGFGMFYVWYYLLKMPLASLLLLAAGTTLVVGTVNRERKYVKDVCLLLAITAFACVAFIVVSWRTDLNYCQRYSLVSLPLFCLLGGSVWAFAKTRWEQAIVVLLGMWCIIAGIRSVPHSLSYYNELAGGVEDGRFMLHGDATDWGQDGFRLGHWCRAYPGRRPLSIATTGFPSNLAGSGVEADSIRMDGAQMMAPLEMAVIGKPIQPEGWHVISIVHLLNPQSPYFSLRYQQPLEWIGETHAVFYLDQTTAEKWRKGTFHVLPPMRGHKNVLP